MDFEMDIDLDSAEMILLHHGLDKGGRVQQKFTMDVRKYCEPYVPMRKKILINNVTYGKDYESFTYQSSYAHYMYEGRLMIDPVTGSSYAKAYAQKVYASPQKDLNYNGAPLRGKHWDKRMWANNGEEILNDLQKFANRGGK